MRRALEWMMLVLLCCCCVTARHAGGTPDSRLVEAQVAFDEGVTLLNAGRYPEALTRAEQALTLRESILGAEHLDVANCLRLMGNIYQRQGNMARAEPLLQRALSLLQLLPGKADHATTQTLLSLAMLYTKQLQYDKAEPLCLRALAIREAALGKSHPDVAEALHVLAVLYTEQERYDQAEPLYRRSLTIREAALGKSHPDVAKTLHGLAALYSSQGLYDQAEPLYRRALAIREQSLGKNHPDVAESLLGLAAFAYTKGLIDQAEPLFQRALAIREAAFGSEDPDVAEVLNNLAILYLVKGLYDQAEPLFQRALAIRENVLGKRRPEVAEVLGNLATLYMGKGLYDQAESLLQRALTIRETALGARQSDVANTLNTLARLYVEKGSYGQAEPLLQRALAISEAALGNNHPVIADSLGRLAEIYQTQGFNDQAEPLLQRALAIRENALGKSHPDVAVLLTGLASLYLDQKSYDRAEPLFQRALAIRENALGKSHPDVAISLSGLAAIYMEHDQLDRAEPLLQRALAINEAAFGESHPAVAVCLRNLAMVDLERGLRDPRFYDRAEPLLQRALAIREASLGASHPDIAISLDDLARLYLRENRLADALPLLRRSFFISEQRLRWEALDFSETRLLGFLSTTVSAPEKTLYLLLESNIEDSELQRMALSAVLLRKNRSLDEAATISHTVYRKLSPEDRDTFDQLRGLRTQLVARLQRSSESRITEAPPRLSLKALATRGDSLEAELARRSAPMRALLAPPHPDEIIRRVASELPKDGALVEFIVLEYDIHRFAPVLPPQIIPNQQDYLALVLLPDASVRAVNLGPAEPIDAAVSRLRTLLAQPRASVEAAAQDVYGRAFQPLRSALGSTRRLFVSPDGQLGLIPFSALHDGHDFLLDSFDFIYLNSGRDLLTHPQDAPPSSSVVVIANPDFTASPLASSNPRGLSPLADRSGALERFFSVVQMPPSKEGWRPLPGTDGEADKIKCVLPQAQLILGLEATKERLLHLPPPGILHIATHGFFIPDEPRLELFQPPWTASLLRSGLVMAGASVGPPVNTIATALELSGMDLWGTQLVVLSACDTGSGWVQSGQGIYGLRRAMAVAGAETVLMSLWPVSDETTPLLMSMYYRHLLLGEGRASALLAAMREFRASSSHPPPHEWAPFISVGSNAPLRAIAPTGVQAHCP
ncbi:CHAT domain-containing protein [Cystobacter fuscus]|nr:CHAT domain-containing protein [Cystobacter fuscus]